MRPQCVGHFLFPSVLCGASPVLPTRERSETGGICWPNEIEGTPRLLASPPIESTRIPRPTHSMKVSDLLWRSCDRHLRRMQVHDFPLPILLMQHDGPAIDKTGPVIKVKRRNCDVLEHLDLQVARSNVHVRTRGSRGVYLLKNSTEGLFELSAPVCSFGKNSRIEHSRTIVERGERPAHAAVAVVSCSTDLLSSSCPNASATITTHESPRRCRAQRRDTSHPTSADGLLIRQQAGWSYLRNRDSTGRTRRAHCGFHQHRTARHPRARSPRWRRLIPRDRSA